MSRYVFIKGFFDTIDLFSEEIAYEFQKKGDKCLFLNMNSMDRDLKSLYKENNDAGITAVIAFNNLGYNLGEDEGANIWERLGIIYVDILMDHPFHFCEKLKKLPRNTILYCIDQNHVQFVKKYFSNIKNVGFLPHAGCLNAIEACHLDTRDIDILYAGSLSRVLVENLIPDFDQIAEIDGVKFSETVLERLFKNPKLTTEQVIEEEIQKSLGHQTVQELLYYIDAFRFIDGFAVSYFRELSVRILVENGFKVNVLGLGWEKCDWADNENLNIIGKVGAKDVIPFMKRSKIVLNTMTWFKEGAHDRIFNGALSGAAVLSDTSGYINREFKDGENIKLFYLDEMSKLPYMAEEILANDDYRSRLAASGEKLCRKNHTWEKRIEIITKDIEEYEKDTDVSLESI